jgi:hypothetical protein
VAGYEKSSFAPSSELFDFFEKYFHVNPAWLIGKDNKIVFTQPVVFYIPPLDRKKKGQLNRVILETMSEMHIKEIEAYVGRDYTIYVIPTKEEMFIIDSHNDLETSFIKFADLHTVSCTSALEEVVKTRLKSELLKAVFERCEFLYSKEAILK